MSRPRFRRNRFKKSSAKRKSPNLSLAIRSLSSDSFNVRRKAVHQLVTASTPSAPENIDALSAVDALSAMLEMELFNFADLAYVENTAVMSSREELVYQAVKALTQIAMASGVKQPKRSEVGELVLPLLVHKNMRYDTFSQILWFLIRLVEVHGISEREVIFSLGGVPKIVSCLDSASSPSIKQQNGTARARSSVSTAFLPRRANLLVLSTGAKCIKTFVRASPHPSVASIRPFFHIIGCLLKLVHSLLPSTDDLSYSDASSTFTSFTHSDSSSGNLRSLHCECLLCIRYFSGMDGGVTELFNHKSLINSLVRTEQWRVDEKLEIPVVQTLGNIVFKGTTEQIKELFSKIDVLDVLNDILFNPNRSSDVRAEVIWCFSNLIPESNGEYALVSNVYLQQDDLNETKTPESLAIVRRTRKMKKSIMTEIIRLLNLRSLSTRGIGDAIWVLINAISGPKPSQRCRVMESYAAVEALLSCVQDQSLSEELRLKSVEAIALFWRYAPPYAVEKHIDYIREVFTAVSGLTISESTLQQLDEKHAEVKKPVDLFEEGVIVVEGKGRNRVGYFADVLGHVVKNWCENQMRETSKRSLDVLMKTQACSFEAMNDVVKVGEDALEWVRFDVDVASRQQPEQQMVDVASDQEH